MNESTVQAYCEPTLFTSAFLWYHIRSRREFNDKAPDASHYTHVFLSSKPVSRKLFLTICLRPTFMTKTSCIKNKARKFIICVVIEKSYPTRVGQATAKFTAKWSFFPVWLELRLGLGTASQDHVNVSIDSNKQIKNNILLLY